MRQWRRSPTLLIAGILVLALAATTGYLVTRRSKAATHAASTARVSRGTVTVSAGAAGTVNVVTTRGLSFSMAATVTELDVKVGDQVTAGQTLAKIDATTAQQQVDAAQQQVSSAQDNLTKAETTATPTPTAASVAKACTVALRIAPQWHPSSVPPGPSDSATPVPSDSAAPSPSASVPTGPTGTRPSTGRSSTGGGAGTGSRQCTGGSGGSGGSGGGSGGTGGSGGNTTNRSGGSGGDALSSAQTQLNNAQLTLEQAQQRLAGTVLTAPIAGRVLTVGGTAGSQERPGGTGFIVLGDLQDTEVQAQFSEAEVASLAVGQPATITLPNQTRPATGKVSQISPAGTVSGRLVRYGVLVAFDQAPSDLLLGQSASVAVTTAQATGVLYVPSSAVTGIQGDSATVKIRSGAHDENRTVTVGLRGDQYTEIKSGLSEGEQVVL